MKVQVELEALRNELEQLYELGRQDERRRLYGLIEGHVKNGNLPGNGCDETAQRNGLILALNLIQQGKE